VVFFWFVFGHSNTGVFVLKVKTEWLWLIARSHFFFTRNVLCKWIYERSYIWTTEKDIYMIDHRSYTHNLSSCETWKKFRPKLDSNPRPLRYRCSALPTELSLKPSGSWSLCEFVIYPQKVKWSFIYLFATLFEKRTVFREWRLRKTVSLEEQTMSIRTNIRHMFAQSWATVFIILKIISATRAVLKIGEYHTDIAHF